MLDQDDVIGLQFIGAAFHHVGDLPFDENGDLVEVVIVVFDLPGLLVRQVEQAELPVQISLFRILRHRSFTSSCDSFISLPKKEQDLQ